MPNKGKFIGSQDNLFVPDAPTIGTATAGDAQVSVAFTAPSDVGGDAVTLYGASVFLAGATINYKVSVGTGTLSTGGSGNIYFIDGNPTKTLSLIKGFTYVFDLSDSSNSGHPFGFKNASDGSYTSGVTTSGTAGNASATVTLVLATDASEPSRYYCTSHGNGMGNTISLIEASASTDPLGAAQAGATGSSSPVTVTGLTNGTSYIAKVWAINDYGNGPLSVATASFSPSLNRAVFGGGTALGNNASNTATGINVMEYVTIASAGNVIDFGDLIHTYNTSLFATMGITAFGNDTRGIFAGGAGAGGGQAGDSDTIQYITYASTSNTTDFGNLPHATHYLTSVSNNVRGVISKGKSTNGTTNEIEYVTIQSTGNTTDFGDLTTARREITNGNTSSKTRGIFAGGRANGAAPQNTIDYITMASAGNATDFGDMTTVRGRGAGSSSETRTVMAGGFTDNAGSTSASSTTINVIDYITTASTGNATDFGDLSATREGLASGSSSTTSVFGGGNTAGGNGINVIESITIASTSNTTDFGDLSANKTTLACCASHAPSGVNETGFAPAAMGLMGGGAWWTGSALSYDTAIIYLDIATDGSHAQFGDLTEKKGGSKDGAASTTRAVAMGGFTGSAKTNVIEYATFSTKGTNTDFGNLSAAAYVGTTSSNSTRGVHALGNVGSNSNTIEYITIASTSNSIDFGDLSSARSDTSSLSSTTRMVIGGGYDTGADYQNIMEYITIASTGNTTDFGDLTVGRYVGGSGSSNTRGLFAGGFGGSNSNVVDYVTIASTGNATDFGDMSTASRYAAAVSDKTSLLVHAGGDSSNGLRIDKFTIASTGNAADWGDLDAQKGTYYRALSTSNSHGGIA